MAPKKGYYGIGSSMAKLVRDCGGDEDMIYAALNDSHFAHHLAEKIVARSRPSSRMFGPGPAKRGTQWLRLLADCKLQEVSNAYTQQNFPLERIDKNATGNTREVKLCKRQTIREVMEELKQRGYNLAGTRRALKYIAAHPGAQLDHEVLAPGTVYRYPNERAHEYIAGFMARYYPGECRIVDLVWIDQEIEASTTLLVY